MTEQLTLNLLRPEPPGFANFVSGANREAVSVLRALAAGRLAETGVLLWGGSGVGKSHLLRAAIAAAQATRPVLYCAAGRDLPDPQDELPPALLVAVDAIDHADPQDQGRLFTLCNTLAATGGQWLAAAASPPARLGLRDDLRTRLALGLVFEVLPLADADKPAALAAYARDRGFRLSGEVIAYLLAHGRRDMPSLVGTLAALDRHSLATRRRITVPLLRDWLQRDLAVPR